MYLSPQPFRAPLTSAQLRVLLAVLSAALFSAKALSAQGYDFEAAIDGGQRLSQIGTAQVIESPGPPLFRNGPINIEHATLNARWIVIQDSTMGVVFTEPSGVKANPPNYDGDVDLRALTRIVAVEVRALLFNVWGDFTGQVTTTRLLDAKLGEAWAMDPRWVDLPRSSNEHQTSIMWVHRAMYEDETWSEAAQNVISEAIRLVTGSDIIDLGTLYPAVPHS
jgi:hypothetical protein